MMITRLHDKVGSASALHADGGWEITAKPVPNETGVRYLDWIESNRRKVAEATGGRIGYMHVQDTSIPGIMAFDKQLTGQLDKNGIIVDERYNAGGQIPDFYTEKLKRSLLAVISVRDGQDVPYPPVAIYGPKVMLANKIGLRWRSLPVAVPRRKDRADRRHANLGRACRHQSRRAAA